MRIVRLAPSPSRNATPPARGGTKGCSRAGAPWPATSPRSSALVTCSAARPSTPSVGIGNRCDQRGRERILSAPDRCRLSNRVSPGRTGDSPTGPRRAQPATVPAQHHTERLPDRSVQRAAPSARLVGAGALRHSTSTCAGRGRPTTHGVGPGSCASCGTTPVPSTAIERWCQRETVAAMEAPAEGTRSRTWGKCEV